MNPDTNHSAPSPPTTPPSSHRSILSLVAVMLGLVLAVFLLISPRSEPMQRLASATSRNGAATPSGCTRDVAVNPMPAGGSGCCAPTAPVGPAGSSGACTPPSQTGKPDPTTKFTPSGAPQ